MDADSWMVQECMRRPLGAHRAAVAKDMSTAARHHQGPIDVLAYPYVVYLWRKGRRGLMLVM